MKKFFIAFIVAFVTLFSACSIKSKEEYYNYSESNISGGDSVTIEILYTVYLAGLYVKIKFRLKYKVPMKMH